MANEITELAEDILQIIPQIMRILEADLRRAGKLMTPGNFQLMFKLQEGPASLSELAESHNVSLPTMSRSVSRLEKIGWIERRSNPLDRRVTLIILTEGGRIRLMEMKASAQESLARALQSSPAQDRDTIADGLDVLRRTFDLYMYDRERD